MQTKIVTNKLNSVLSKENCRFVGNVALGRDLSLTELQSAYNAVLLCFGAAGDKELNIPGEKLRNVLSARDFVNWYNGHPDYEYVTPDLSGDTAVVIGSRTAPLLPHPHTPLGNGNVALDVARIILRPVEELRATDISPRAISALSDSKIQNVHIVGRRGPVQAAWTTPELREIGGIGCRVWVGDLALGAEDASEMGGARVKERCMGLLKKYPTTAWGEKKVWSAPRAF